MSKETHARSLITALILAGGKAQRMGGRDKGLVKIMERPMIEHVIEAIRPQVSQVLINANRNQDKYAHYGLSVIADRLEGFHGPLAGMASALDVIETEYLLSLPCDSPHVPGCLARRLYRALAEEDAALSVAHDGQRLQPVFCLLKASLRDSMLGYLDDGGRKIDRWFAQHKMATADFSEQAEAFINVNSLKDIAQIEAALTASAAR